MRDEFRESRFRTARRIVTRNCCSRRKSKEWQRTNLQSSQGHVPEFLENSTTMPKRFGHRRHSEKRYERRLRLWARQALTRRLKFFAAVVLAFIVGQALVYPKILDPRAAPDSLLDSLAKGLDSKTGGPSDDRAHLGRLEGYTSVVKAPPIRFSWMTEFVNDNGALVAVRGESGRVVSRQNLRSSWNKAPRENRVFVW